MRHDLPLKAGMLMLLMMIEVEVVWIVLSMVQGLILMWSDGSWISAGGPNIVLIQILASLALYDTTKVSHLATNLCAEFIPACP